MTARRVIRALARYSLLPEILDLLYWVAAIVILIQIARALGDNWILLTIALALYCAGIVAAYFAISKGIQRFVDSERE